MTMNLVTSDQTIIKIGHQCPAFIVMILFWFNLVDNEIGLLE